MLFRSKEAQPNAVARMNYLGMTLLARPFRTQEIAILSKSLKDIAGFYKSHEKEAKSLLMVGESKPDASLAPESLATWTMLTNQLMNLDEVLNK